jgi:hypothetical protein
MSSDHLSGFPQGENSADQRSGCASAQPGMRAHVAARRDCIMVSMVEITLADAW